MISIIDFIDFNHRFQQRSWLLPDFCALISTISFTKCIQFHLYVLITFFAIYQTHLTDATYLLASWLRRHICCGRLVDVLYHFHKPKYWILFNSRKELYHKVYIWKTYILLPSLKFRKSTVLSSCAYMYELSQMKKD